MDELQKSWGVELEPVSEDLCQALQIQGGVIVKNLKDGPWLRQGLRKGFIVLRIDGAPILLNEDIERVVQRAARHGEDGLLLEGMYANGERGFAGVAVPHVRPQRLHDAPEPSLKHRRQVARQQRVRGVRFRDVRPQLIKSDAVGLKA